MTHAELIGYVYKQRPEIGSVTASHRAHIDVSEHEKIKHDDLHIGGHNNPYIKLALVDAYLEDKQ